MVDQEFGFNFSTTAHNYIFRNGPTEEIIVFTEMLLQQMFPATDTTRKVEKLGLAGYLDDQLKISNFIIRCYWCIWSDNKTAVNFSAQVHVVSLKRMW